MDKITTTYIVIARLKRKIFISE